MPVTMFERVALMFGLFLSLFIALSSALRFEQQFVGYNLNQNQTAVDVSDYYGTWVNHTYQPSPSNWRFPFYTLFLDKYANGDPTNDDINGTVFEHDVM
jgi:alpha-1,3-glucan synthase